jgi:methyltransferase (TIGR00027 family)
MRSRVRAHTPSRTAAWVAAWRGLGAFLPEDARLADDPYGLRFAGRFSRSVARAARRFPRAGARVLARDEMFHMQIRTRALDDELLRFVAQGGRQILLLGAGFDCRARRFQRELEDRIVYEVDHPATQAKKRCILAGVGTESAPVVYLPWDFEVDRMDDLPARLAALGHDPGRPTLTIWEGVSMFLSPAAIDATVAALRALSAPRSPFAFQYLDRRGVEHPPLRLRLTAALVARLGEPMRFGWDPPALPAWLAARSFTLVSDRTDEDLARALLPPRYAHPKDGAMRHIAVAERRAGDA